VRANSGSGFGRSGYLENQVCPLRSLSFITNLAGQSFASEVEKVSSAVLVSWAAAETLRRGQTRDSGWTEESCRVKSTVARNKPAWGKHASLVAIVV